MAPIEIKAAVFRSFRHNFIVSEESLGESALAQVVEGISISDITHWAGGKHLFSSQLGAPAMEQHFDPGSYYFGANLTLQFVAVVESSFDS